MSPTLLELIVALLLLLLACLIGVWIAPGVFAAVANFWRAAAPPPPPGPERWPPEKNVTPPPAPGETSRKKT